jgi:MFS family permease
MGLNSGPGPFELCVILTIICFVSVDNYFCYHEPAALADIYKKEYSLTAPQFGSLFTAYSLPNVALVFGSGLLVDRLGMGLCGVLFNTCILLGAVVCALAPSADPHLSSYRVFQLLLLGRLLIGIGGESVVATTLKMISRSFASTSHLNTAMAVNQAVIQLLGSSLPFLWLPSLGGVKEANRALLAVCASSLSASLLYLSLERGCSKRFFGPDSAEEKDDEEKHLLSKTTDAEKPPAARPATALETLRSFPPSFWVLLLHIALTSPVLWTFSDFGCLYLQERFPSQNYTPDSAGKTMSLLYLGIVLAPFSAMLIDKVGRHRPLIQFIAASCVPFLFLTLDLGILSPSCSLASLGLLYGVTETNGFALVAVIVPEEVQGAAFGLVGCAISVALIVEPWAVGMLRDQYGAFGTTITMFLTVTLLGAGVAGGFFSHMTHKTKQRLPVVLLEKGDCRL